MRRRIVSPGGRILDCRPVPDEEVGHARSFVCFHWFEYKFLGAISGPPKNF